MNIVNTRLRWDRRPEAQMRLCQKVRTKSFCCECLRCLTHHFLIYTFHFLLFNHHFLRFNHHFFLFNHHFLNLRSIFMCLSTIFSHLNSIFSCLNTISSFAHSNISCLNTIFCCLNTLLFYGSTWFSYVWYGFLMFANDCLVLNMNFLNVLHYVLHVIPDLHMFFFMDWFW